MLSSEERIAVNGKTLTVAGPEALTSQQIADEVAVVRRAEVLARTISLEQLLERMLAVGLTEYHAGCVVGSAEIRLEAKCVEPTSSELFGLKVRANTVFNHLCISNQNIRVCAGA